MKIFQKLSVVRAMLVLAGVLALGFAMPTPAHAVDLFQNLSPPCMECGNCALEDFLVLAKNISLFLLELTAVVFVLIVVYAGITMTLSHGNEEWIDRARRILQGGALGLIVTLTAWIFINTVVFFLAGGTVFGKEWFTFTAPTSTACYVLPTEQDESSVTANNWNLKNIRSAQIQDASPSLTSMLNCIFEKVPDAAITSISDDDIYTGNCQLSQCNRSAHPSCQIGACNNDNRCVHRCGSCHYGTGTQPGTGFSYAADFDRSIGWSRLINAVRQCDSGFRLLNEGDHFHLEETAYCN